MIYLIKKLWTDSLENSRELAAGYENVGYVTSADEANKITDNCRTFSKSRCWALDDIPPSPEYIWERIEPFIKESEVQSISKEQIQQLKHGLYEIYYVDGGMSLATVGSLHDGGRWFSCANWTAQDEKGVCSTHWELVKEVKLIREVEYDV